MDAKRRAWLPSANSGALRGGRAHRNQSRHPGGGDLAITADPGKIPRIRHHSHLDPYVLLDPLPSSNATACRTCSIPLCGAMQSCLAYPAHASSHNDEPSRCQPLSRRLSYWEVEPSGRMARLTARAAPALHCDVCTHFGLHGGSILGVLRAQMGLYGRTFLGRPPFCTSCDASHAPGLPVLVRAASLQNFASRHSLDADHLRTSDCSRFSTASRPRPPSDRRRKPSTVLYTPVHAQPPDPRAVDA
ncbi:hypothetical protein K523DRAFT_90190 [Schizophyllum commune Tattone D]|nr:hypothetical protein K523DRAFT_90190 [Schizophyllum commune Tattone D]